MDTLKVLELATDLTYGGGKRLPLIGSCLVAEEVLSITVGPFIHFIFERAKASPTAKARASWKDYILLPKTMGWEDYGYLPTALQPTDTFAQVTAYLNERLVGPKGELLKWLPEPQPVALPQAAIVTALPTRPSSNTDPLAISVSPAAKSGSHYGDPTVTAPPGSDLIGSNLPPLNLVQ